MNKWLDRYESGGLVSKNSLNRNVTCSNCGWSWKLSDGGLDPMTCHKCGGDIKMREGGELDEYQNRGEVLSPAQQVALANSLAKNPKRITTPAPTVSTIRQGYAPTPYSEALRNQRNNEYARNKAMQNSDLAKTFASFTPGGDNVDAGVIGAETFANLNPVLSGPILSASRLAPAIMHPTNNAYWGADRSLGENALGTLGAFGDVTMLSPYFKGTLPKIPRGLDDNATFINLKRASPKLKSKMYKASEVVDDPNFNIKKIYRGDKENPKVIKVQGKSGEWTVNKSNDGSYYFNAAMSSPLESGKAMLKINEMLHPKPTILEPNSLSLDSYLNTIKIGKRPHWKMEFENYIPLNHSAVNNKTISNKFGFKPEGTQVPFNSLEDANSALKEVNAMLKKQGITQEADIFSNGNNNYGIKIPNFKLTRDYKNGGQLDKYKTKGEVRYNVPSSDNLQYQKPIVSNFIVDPLSGGYVHDPARAAALLNQSINPGTISKTKDRSIGKQIYNVATNPMTSAQQLINKQPVTGLGPKNPFDFAFDAFPAMMAARQLPQIPGNLQRGEYLQAGLNTLTAFPIASMAGKLSKVALREGVDLVHPVGRALQQIEKKGIANGLSPQEIKNLQMQEVGITSAQREGYFPGVSEIVSEYITPYSYDNAKKRILDIPRRIIKGEKNSKSLADLDHNFIFDFETKNLVSKPRYDAWRMYSGLPQEYGTFRLAETSPINHPSYSAEQLDKLEKFSLNDERRLLRNLPNPMDNAHFSYQEKDDLIEAIPLLKEELNQIKDLKNKGIDYSNDFNNTNVMGGYNRRFFNDKMEYNDIWDLDLNGNKVEKYFGKPFLSHGQLDYSFQPAEDEINRLIKLGESYSKNITIKKPPRLNFSFKDNGNYNSLLTSALQKRKKLKQGGPIITNRGQWDYPGQTTIIPSNKITMQGVNGPLYLQPNKGNGRLAYPNEEHYFPKASFVVEHPIKWQIIED